MDKISIKNRLREQRRRGFYRTRDDIITDCIYKAGF